MAAHDEMPLRLGQRIHLALDGDPDATWLASRVEGADQSGQRLTVAWPTERGKLVDLPTAAILELGATAHQDALYSAQVRIDNARHNKLGVPLLDLTRIGDWRRVQRRDTVRAAVSIEPLQAARATPWGPQRLTLTVTNLSIGGLRVVTSKRLRIGDQLSAAFALDDDDEGDDNEQHETLHAEVVVRRVEPYGRGQFEAGCQFVWLDHGVEHRIARFIFRQQRLDLARARKL